MRHSRDNEFRNEPGPAGETTNPGFFEKILGLLGFEAEEIVEDNEIAATYEEPLKRDTRESRESRDRGKVVSLTNSYKSMKMIILEPTEFEEVQAIVDHLKNKQTVILNLEETDKVIARRIADFLGGAVYALDGSVKKVSNSILLFAPAGVEVTLPLRPIVREEETERNAFSASLSSTLFKKERETRRD
ncbi:MAG TPA: cell division protein SepF [Bacillota bacterium]|nr:cell division protein SepF [Bacillota bacterium]HPT87049.1 cell division protein SepF [Bacillota bacterium]